MKMAFGFVICWIAGGCWGAEPASEESSSAQPSPAPAQALEKSEGGTHAACRALMLRQRECSAEFIPALVDARVERDEPAGVAAQARDIGRDALVAEALEEWQSDSRDEAIEAVCSEIARSIAPGRVQELESSVRACLAHSTCEAFVACAVPVNLGRWKS